MTINVVPPRIAPRFQRSVRIDTDYATESAIEDFICPPSFAEALTAMARHIADTGQGAFTWTGPYGGGKSSLALAFACLVGAKKPMRERAADALGSDVVDTFKSSLAYFPARWRVLPVVARRTSLARVLADALDVDAEQAAGDLNQAVLDALAEQSRSSGLVLIVDELGRALEAAAEGDGDVHLLQDIAELASRSERRLIVIGVLHQSFEEYAQRLGREARDTWAKIQGRFVDIPIAVGLDETIDLIGKAVVADGASANARELAETVASEIRPLRAEEERKRIASSLASCAPLHPVVACLLGPLSRRRFGQNQRSVFSFLSSSEPCGFQDFIRQAKNGDLYRVDQLWDYLKANLDAPILASPDSRRWALADDAIERCLARGGSTTEVRLLKTVAVLEMLKERSGLSATPEVLGAAADDLSKRSIDAAMKKLAKASEVMFRNHVGAYAVFAGSDFDIEAAVGNALNVNTDVDLSAIRSLVDLQPMLAKRHYGRTGAMRWFDVAVTSLDDIAHGRGLDPRGEAIGVVVLAVPTNGETPVEAEAICAAAAEAARAHELAIGLADGCWRLAGLLRELQALLALEADRPELRGDAVARREIAARTAELKHAIESLVHASFSAARWRRKDGAPTTLSRRALNEMLSDIADDRFSASPIILNELLNRTRPSSNAVAARTALMKRMVLNEAEEDLGLSGYPAERGLYDSILLDTEIHCGDEDDWRFTAPTPDTDEGRQLAPLWECADALLAAREPEPVTGADIIAAWAEPPIGLRDGLAPVLLVAYALSRRDQVAVYREGVFQARFDDLSVEFLARDPGDIALRRVELGGFTQDVLTELSRLVDGETNDEPLAVARALVAEFERLEPWTRRTQRLSPDALKVRDVLKQAADPNKLLFEDLPSLVAPDAKGEIKPRKVAAFVRDAVADLRAAYPRALEELKTLMLKELDARQSTPEGLAELRGRADNIRQLTGNLRLNAFIARIAQFHGTVEDMEGVAGIAADRHPRDWNDTDRENAALGIADLSQQFLRAETFARVKGRRDKRNALAVVVGLDNHPTPLFREFEISDADREDIAALVVTVDEALSKADDASREVILAALAEISSRYMHAEEEVEKAAAKPSAPKPQRTRSKASTTKTERRA